MRYHKAWVVMHQRRSLAVLDKRYSAENEVRRLRANGLDAAFSGFRSRLAAEEFFSWHNYQYELAEKASRLKLKRRIAGRKAAKTRSMNRT